MTLINHEYRFVFVHIPKNAGTSVALALAPLMTYRDQEIGGTELGQAIADPYRQRFGIGKHSTLREILAVIGAPSANEYRSFCVSRDPADRVASTFEFLRRWNDWESLPRFRPYVAEFQHCETLDDFVASEFFATPGPDRLFLPQVSWITGQADEVVGVDSVLRIERIWSGVRQFLLETGVPATAVESMSLPVANRSPRSSSALRLSDASRAILAARYAQDFRYLGYRLGEA